MFYNHIILRIRSPKYVVFMRSPSFLSEVAWKFSLLGFGEKLSAAHCSRKASGEVGKAEIY